jgi:hypothetical protein
MDVMERFESLRELRDAGLLAPAEMRVERRRARGCAAFRRRRHVAEERGTPTAVVPLRGP